MTQMSIWERGGKKRSEGGEEEGESLHRVNNSDGNRREPAKPSSCLYLFGFSAGGKTLERENIWRKGRRKSGRGMPFNCSSR